MKLLQIAFIVALGSASFATYATSETLHTTCLTEQDITPALSKI